MSGGKKGGKIVEAPAGCAYCTNEAKGVDDDGEPTCGDAETCSAVALDPSSPRVKTLEEIQAEALEILEEELGDDSAVRGDLELVECCESLVDVVGNLESALRGIEKIRKRVFDLLVDVANARQAQLDEAKVKAWETAVKRGEI